MAMIDDDEEELMIPRDLLLYLTGRADELKKDQAQQREMHAPEDWREHLERRFNRVE